MFTHLELKSVVPRERSMYWICDQSMHGWYMEPTCHEKSRLQLRWRASNVTQRCNNWRRGFRFTTLERPSRSCRGHPWCHATCLVPRLFLGLYWPRSELSATLYVLRTMTMPTANFGEIPCYFSVRLKNQLNDFSRNGLQIQLLH